MQFRNRRRSALRRAVSATFIAVLLTSGVASAMPFEVGLTACDYDGCAVVTLDDLATKSEPATPPTLPGRAGFTE